MYTVPKPSNGAPTAMSGEERQKGVTTGTVGPLSPQPCAPATETSMPVTSPCQAVLTPSGNRALWLRLKLGPLGAQMPPFIRGKVGPGEGSDPVMRQASVPGSLHPRSLTTGWCLFSLITAPATAPSSLPSKRQVLPVSCTSRGTTAGVPLVTLPGGCQALVWFNTPKGAGCKHYCPHATEQETNSEIPQSHS